MYEMKNYSYLEFSLSLCVCNFASLSLKTENADTF